MLGAFTFTNWQNSNETEVYTRRHVHHRGDELAAPRLAAGARNRPRRRGCCC